MKQILANLNTVEVTGGIILDVNTETNLNSMHLYGKIIVDLNNMMTLDLNADLYGDPKGEIGANLKAYFQCILGLIRM